MSNNLYEKTLFTTRQELILGDIYEYDIYKSNISMLLKAKYITQEDYNFYASLPKLDRQIIVGKLMLKDKKIYSIISEQLKDVREKIIKYNNVSDDEIISIKNDAIFTTRKLSIIEFDNVKFREANHYKMFINLNKDFHIELYFEQNEEDYILDVKGISDDKLLLHHSYMYILCNTFNMVVNHNYTDALQYFTTFCKIYDNMDISNLEIYREFNSKSEFTLKMPNNNISYSCTNIPNNISTDMINIDYNRFLNKKILSILTMLYFKAK